jgi:hypothetical protein
MQVAFSLFSFPVLCFHSRMAMSSLVLSILPSMLRTWPSERVDTVSCMFALARRIQQPEKLCRADAGTHQTLKRPMAVSAFSTLWTRTRLALANHQNPAAADPAPPQQLPSILTAFPAAKMTDGESFISSSKDKAGSQPCRHGGKVMYSFSLARARYKGCPFTGTN